MLAQLDALQTTALADLAAAADPDAVEAWRIAYLGSKGRLKAMMPGLKDVSKADKPAVGKRLNEVKVALESGFEDRKVEVASSGAASGPQVDVTQPGLDLPDGRRHVLSRTIDEIVDIFGRMGFTTAEGPEVEDEWHNFTALNIPAGHPARDPIDNFFMGEQEGSRTLLRTQTSTVQIRTLEKQKPPVRIIACGRVYRPDTHDATHYSMFHQVEGLCVDRGVTMVDLKTTLFQFARAYFGPEAEVRMRPSFFPFTEPSAEVDMKMKIKGEWQWIEIGGCGMVDPNVLEAVGVDPEEFTGFAFGLGIERVAMRKYGISDIRWLYENDVRFLDQF
ncbi:MAG: phenylalanine--tRNA ligase subunit alpha [Phycisphaeraceae bacterium]|nr:phenylalanine--tRNA ligase subunit alpha [Phycisphaeraceae bacterium]